MDEMDDIDKRLYDAMFEDRPRPETAEAKAQRLHEEVQYVEYHGFIGFKSYAEIQDFGNARDYMFLESVIVAEALTGTSINRPSQLDWLVVPTRTRGLITVKLPSNSPHEKDVRGFIMREAEKREQAKASGTPLPDHSQSFAEWWLGEGGKFHILNVQHRAAQPTRTYAAQPTRTYAAQPTRTYAGSSTDAGTTGSTSGKPLAAFRVSCLPFKVIYSHGAYRIWKELDPLLPIHFEKGKRVHNISTFAPPSTVDLRMLKDVYITAYELLVWFPEHNMRWHDFIKRLDGAGWPPKDMFILKYLIRGFINSSIPHAQDIKDEIEYGRKRFVNVRRRVKAKEPDHVWSPYKDLTCANWTPPVHDPSITRAYGEGYEGGGFLTDYYVSDIMNGVDPAVFPIGDNAGPLTMVIRYALDHPDECKALKLSDVSAFAKNKGFFRTPPTYAVDKHPDVMSLQEFRSLSSFATPERRA